MTTEPTPPRHTPLPDALRWPDASAAVPAPASAPHAPSSALLADVVAHCRMRLAGAFPRQIHAAVAALDDAELWWRPHASTNSVGHLVRHLAGNVRHIVGHLVGGSAYVRDREAEFAAPPVPRAALLAEFDAAIAEADGVLAALPVARLGEPSREPAHYATVLEDLLNVTIHMATHVGQIVWIAKLLREGALDDVWRRAHREVGAYGRALRRDP